MKIWKLTALVVLLGAISIIALWTWIKRAPQAPQNLVIYSATDRKAMQPIIDAFEHENPTLTINYEEFGTVELEQWMRAQSDHYSPDLVISSATNLQIKLVNDGYARAFTPDNYDQLPSWSRWRHEIYGFTLEPVVMVYNREAFTDRHVPTTHERLAAALRDDPLFYQRRIATYDIRKSGVGYMIATQDELRSNLTGRLNEGLGRAYAQVFCCSSDILQAVSEGRMVFGYNVLGSYALSRAVQDKAIGVILPKDYTLAITRTVFIPRRAVNVSAAEAFINFLVSDQGQQVIAQRSDLIALNRAVEGRASWATLQREQTLNPLPIKVEPALMVYLDEIKHQHFIDQWENTLFYSPEPP